MKKRHLFITICLSAVMILLAPVALASDVSDALYTGIIRVSNNSTATTNCITPVTGINTTVFMQNNWLNSSANNSVIRNTSGADIEFMPGNDTNPWLVWTPSIGADTYQNDVLYTHSTNGDIRYFPGAGGMTTTDHADIEWGDNFTYQARGFVDTDNGTGKDIYQKTSSANVYVSADQALTADLTSFSANLTLRDTQQGLYSGAVERCGQRYDDFPRSRIQSASFYMIKSGSPPGDLYCRIRAVSGDTLLGTLGSMAADSLTGAWTEYTFDDTTINLTEAQDVRAVIEYSGGDGSNYVLVGCYNADAVSGNFTYYNGSWTDDNAIDTTYQVLAANTLTIEDVDTDEHTIEVETDNTSLFWGFGVDNTYSGYPVTGNLTLNAPFWHSQYDDGYLVSKDANELTFSATGATWSSDGYVFDGDDYLNFGNTPETYGTELSFAAWVNLDSVDTAHSVVCRRNTAAANLQIWLYHNGSNGWTYYSGNGSATNSDIFLHSTQADTWYYIGFVFDNGSVYSIIDGVRTLESNAFPPSIQELAQPLAVGCYNLGGTPSVYLSGTIGEIHFNRKALSEAEVLANYNATRWKYQNADEAYTYDLLFAGGVRDTSANITEFQNSVMPFVEYSRTYIDGVLTRSIAWNYGDTFTDLTGNGHDATPSFRTTGTHANVSAELLSFMPVTEADAPAYTIDVSSYNFTDSIATTGQYTTTTNASGDLIQPVIDVSEASGTPSQLPLLIIACVVILAVSLGSTYVLRNNQAASLTVQMIIIIVSFAVGIGLDVIDEWMMILLVPIVAGLAMSSGTIFQGTGFASNNIFGFAVSSFVGLTIINRVLEGRVILSADLAIVENFLAWRPFSVFGWFSIPVPNVSFLTNGIPALLNWGEYSFFTGNAQYVVYLLYSISAVVAFILFTLALGSIYQMFSRAR